jgi:ATP-dependent Clp protease ATP-binding subunit ClpA
MSNPRFPILGKEIPPMLGRTRIMQRLWRDLTKPTPSNLSLIGPRFMGKTVIMNALAQRIANEASPFEFVLY